MPWGCRADRGSRNRTQPGSLGRLERQTVLIVLIVRAEVAVALRTSVKAIYSMNERGQLPGVVRIGRRILVKRPNRHKPAGIAAKETILNNHLVPFLGSRRLDEIRNEDVQQLKQHLTNKAAKTVNNVLTVLA